MNTEQIIFNVMAVVEDNLNKLKAMEAGAFHSDDDKLVMAGIVAQLDLLVSMFGNTPDEPPPKGNWVDGILHRK